MYEDGRGGYHRTPNVNDFVDRKSRRELPDDERQQIAKYYNVTNKHLQLNPRKQKQYFMDDDWN